MLKLAFQRLLGSSLIPSLNWRNLAVTLILLTIVINFLQISSIEDKQTSQYTKLLYDTPDILSIAGAHSGKQRARHGLATFIGEHYPGREVFVPRELLDDDVTLSLLAFGRVSRMHAYRGDISLDKVRYEPFEKASQPPRRGEGAFVVATRMATPKAFILIRRGRTDIMLDVSLVPDAKFAGVQD